MAKKTTLNSDIIIKGARVNNLKNIDVEIPRNKLVVITGLSGSGKSSLAFDTLYAEGQRRYVESLSAYARQFLGKMAKPECDMIKGLPPAIAIEQKVNTRNPRSTVGTATEIYDYLRLLFGRVGRTFSPQSGQEVKKHTTDSVVDMAKTYPEGTRIAIAAPIVLPEKRKFSTQLDVYLKAGFSRLVTRNGEFVQITDILAEEQTIPDSPDGYMLLVDRLAVVHEGDELSRLADSVETAFLKVPELPNSWCGVTMELCVISFPIVLRLTALHLWNQRSRCSISITPTVPVLSAKGLDGCKVLTSDLWCPIRSGLCLTVRLCAGVARKWDFGVKTSSIGPHH